MDIHNLKAVVFDCDGVLFDTALANRKFYDAILDTHHKSPLTDEQFINVHMMTVKGAVEYLFPEVDDPKIIYETIKSIGYARFNSYMQMEDGLVELLDALKENGFIRGIATNRTNTMEQVLDDFNLAHCFDLVMTAGKVKRPKPDPEQLVKIMDHFELDPHEILFVGDSSFDEQAARNAGTHFAAFRSEKLVADVHVDSMKALQNLLLPNK